ncbi:MAG TPA: sulfur transferase domain-containing protein [Sorangium sp.]|nr:sulfur transferase domain-containing protein [Sorangium sp.]
MDIRSVGGERPARRGRADERAPRAVQVGRQPALALGAGLSAAGAGAGGAAGLRYVNLPVSPTEATEEILDRVVEETRDLPQPVLFHCAAGARAGGLALAAWAEGEKPDRRSVEERAQAAGVKPEQPHLKRLLARLPGDR